MAKVCDVLAFLDTIAPTDLKMDWDNVGLLCGRREAQIHKILVALDPFEDVCREAAQVGADLIVTHHPLIFSPLKAVTADDAVGRSILFLAARGISAVNAHTNLDRAPGGVNDRLAQALGLEDVQDPGAGQLIGVAAQGKVQGHTGQVLLGCFRVNGLGGVIESTVQSLAEIVIELRGAFSRFSSGI